jgi:hypothetical protein
MAGAATGGPPGTGADGGGAAWDSALDPHLAQKVEPSLIVAPQFVQNT